MILVFVIITLIIITSVIGSKSLRGETVRLNPPPPTLPQNVDKGIDLMKFNDEDLNQINSAPPPNPPPYSIDNHPLNFKPSCPQANTADVMASNVPSSILHAE